MIAYRYVGYRQGLLRWASQMCNMFQLATCSSWLQVEITMRTRSIYRSFESTYTRVGLTCRKLVTVAISSWISWDSVTSKRAEKKESDTITISWFVYSLQWQADDFRCISIVEVGSNRESIWECVVSTVASWKGKGHILGRLWNSLLRAERCSGNEKVQCESCSPGLPYRTERGLPVCFLTCVPLTGMTWMHEQELILINGRFVQGEIVLAWSDVLKVSSHKPAHRTSKGFHDADVATSRCRIQRRKKGILGLNCAPVIFKEI